MTYDFQAQGPYQHTWWINEIMGEWEKTVFFPAPTPGMDTNTTIDVMTFKSLILHIFLMTVFSMGVEQHGSL